MIYDSLNKIDVDHVACIERDVELFHVRLPASGHTTLDLLREAGLLPGVIRQLMQGRYDHAQTRAAIRARRRTLLQYWISLSFRLQEHGHARAAIDAALTHACLSTDKPRIFQWAFARAAQMGRPITPERLDALPEPDRAIARAVLAASRA